MGKFWAILAFFTILITYTVLQGQAAKLPRRIPRRRGNAESLENVENLNNECRRPRGRSALLPQGLVDSTCSKMDVWNQHRLANKTVPDRDLNQLVKNLYKSLGKPYPATKPKVPQARKEYRMLTDEERKLFNDAVNVLKHTSVGDTNFYDALIDIHQATNSPGAHQGPAFPGWHKQFTLLIESGLQAVDPSITVPYWDSCMDNRLEMQVSNSIMWTEDFVGNREGQVVTGPFANWKMPRPYEGQDYLFRGVLPGRRPLSDEEFENTMQIEDYRGMTFFVDSYFEFSHGSTHQWVGGPMDDFEESPNDPVFFLHHSFIDFMVDRQRALVVEKHGKEAYFYPTTDDTEAFGPAGENSAHYATAQMLPFDLLNQDSLDEEYLTTYYFAPRPTCSAANPDCGSPYLFCIDGSFLCAPKLVSGTNCLNFATSDPCYQGSCVQGTCQ